MTRTFFLGALLAGASCLPAQQNIVYHPNNIVPGTKNAFPFGAARNGVRQQQLIPGSVLGSSPVLIQDLFVSHQGGFSTNTQTEGEIVYGDFEIRMGVTSIPALTAIWANNLPNPTTVQKGRLRMRWKQNTFLPLGLQVPFLWAPTSANDSLCVDFILWNVIDTGGLVPDVNGYIMGTNADSLMARCWLLNWPINQTGNATPGPGGVKLGFLLGNGNFVGRGLGCMTSAQTRPQTSEPANAWPTLGQIYNLSLSNGAPTRPSFPFLGVSETTWGAIQLPVDLTPFNATGCWVWIDPSVLLGATNTSATGAATTPIPIPNAPTLLGGRLYASWAQLDPTANGLGVVTSDYALLILGR